MAHSTRLIHSAEFRQKFVASIFFGGQASATLVPSTPDVPAGTPTLKAKPAVMKWILLTTQGWLFGDLDGRQASATRVSFMQIPTGFASAAVKIGGNRSIGTFEVFQFVEEFSGEVKDRNENSQASS
jgi:hypothetical protein